MRALLALLLLAGCPREENVPVCGLHSAAAPLVLLDRNERAIAAIRLVLPDGAEATLMEEGQKLELEGPMDVRLR